jgi:hypothetical protein
MYRNSGETQRMDRKILLRHLVQAEQDVAEGKAFIAKQQRLIVESERDDCQDVAETIAPPGSVSSGSAITRGGPRKNSSTSYLSKYALGD